MHEYILFIIFLNIVYNYILYIYIFSNIVYYIFKYYIYIYSYSQYVPTSIDIMYIYIRIYAHANELHGHIYGHIWPWRLLDRDRPHIYMRTLGAARLRLAADRTSGPCRINSDNKCICIVFQRLHTTPVSLIAALHPFSHLRTHLCAHACARAWACASTAVATVRAVRLGSCLAATAQLPRGCLQLPLCVAPRQLPGRCQAASRRWWAAAR
jgi:hypothetical protein